MTRQDRESRIDEWAALVDASVPESTGGDPSITLASRTPETRTFEYGARAGDAGRRGRSRDVDAGER